MMFLLSILVIWAHSYNAELFSGGAPVTEGIWLTVHRIQDFLSTALGLTAVPGFFMLSAYLFFRSFSWEKLPAKWKSRVRSVAVPYLAWNLFYYLGYVLATRIPAVHRLIGKPPVPFNGEELLAAVLHYQYAPVFWYLYQLMFLILLSPVLYWMGYVLATRIPAVHRLIGKPPVPFNGEALLEAVLHYQYAPVFWYLYQLMFLILLSPVLYWIIKNRTRGLVFLAAVMAAVHFHLDTMHPNTDALLYYSFGIFMAVHGRELAEASYGKGRILAGLGNLFLAAVCFWRMGKPGADVLWIVMFRFFLPISIWLLFDSGRIGKTRPWMRQSLFLYGIHFILVRVFNKAGALVLGRVLDSGRIGKTRPWMRQSLFLYGIHFILVRVFNKAGALVLGRVLDGTAMAVLAVVWFLLLPAAVVASSYAAARILVRYVPAVWQIFSGGRSLD